MNRYDDFTDEELQTILSNGLQFINGTHPDSGTQAAQDAERLAPYITALALGALGEDEEKEARS